MQKERKTLIMSESREVTRRVHVCVCGNSSARPDRLQGRKICNTLTLLMLRTYLARDHTIILSSQNQGG